MNTLKADDIYDNCLSATAQVNTELGIGSGFFIPSGKLVTNYRDNRGFRNKCSA